MSRWSKSGVLDRIFAELQRSQIARIKIEAVSLDSTSMKVHPDTAGALKKNGPQAIGKSRGGRNTKIHLVAANERTALKFSLSPGQAHDAPQGRTLLRQPGASRVDVYLLMSRAYESRRTRAVTSEVGFIPVVPLSQKRLEPWQYDKQFYKRRNEVERLFHRLKGFSRVFTCYDKPNLIFVGAITFALIIDGSVVLISPIDPAQLLRIIKIRSPWACQKALISSARTNS